MNSFYNAGLHTVRKLLALDNSKKTTTTKPASQPKQEKKKPVDELKGVLEDIGKGLGGLFK